MQDKEKIIINDHIQGDPLSEENLNKTLEYVNRFRLLIPEKTIWLYSGYTWEEIQNPKIRNNASKMKQIIMSCVDIFVDGRYIDSQRDVSLRWRGSKNQRVVDTQKSLQQGKVVLYCD